MPYVIYNANKIELDKDISIGRDKINCDLVIPEGTVSRSHAIIKKIGEKFYIIDLGSSNGTYKDSKRIHSPVLLENKSLIQCGKAQIVFYDEDESDEDETMLSFSSNFVVNSIVLVADIKGYTSFSENAPIQTVSKVMSAWLKEVDAAVVKLNGYVDSFIGDCVYARWDNQVDKETGKNVIKLAKEINDLTKKISQKVTEGEFNLEIGVGIHTGEVIVGAETQNTGLGDTINTTFRLESATRGLGVDVVISEELNNLCELNKELKSVELKGKTETKVATFKFHEIDNL
jgi:adenylate cyclase